MLRSPSHDRDEALPLRHSNDEDTYGDSYSPRPWQRDRSITARATQAWKAATPTTRGLLGAAFLLFCFLTFRFLFTTTNDTSLRPIESPNDRLYIPAPKGAPFASPVHAEHAVKRPLPPAHQPRELFRPNLLPGERYITAMPYQGFSNQFQSAINLLYLALKTERTAILPLMQPVHIAPPSFARFSDFFDLDFLQRATGVSLVEWADLKSFNSTQNEQIACWATMEASTGRRGARKASPVDRDEMSFKQLAVKPVYWPLPEHIRGTPWRYTPFDQLIAFDEDAEYKREWVQSVKAGESSREPPRVDSLEPDEDLLCFDDTFYLIQPTRPVTDAYPNPLYGPQLLYNQLGISDSYMQSWRAIGQYLRWTKQVETATDDFLRHTLSLSSSRPIPPFIAVHIRHGDFWQQRVVEPFVAKVDEVRRTLNETAGGPFEGKASEMVVVCSTDERKPAFVQSVRDQGWHILDHESFRTIEKYDGWWEPVLSASILSRGQGFVGTHWSTFSIYAWIRVLTWQEYGVGTEVA